MFWVWMILEIGAALCTSAVESVAKGKEQLTLERCKKIDIIVVISAVINVLLLLMGYYRVQMEPELFGYRDKVNTYVLLGYTMMFGGIYGVIMLLIAAIPYSIRKSLDSRSAFEEAQNGSSAEEDREPSDDEWKCKGCGKIHMNYVSTCSCGKSKYDR